MIRPGPPTTRSSESSAVPGPGSLSVKTKALFPLALGILLLQEVARHRKSEPFPTLLLPASSMINRGTGPEVTFDHYELIAIGTDGQQKRLDPVAAFTDLGTLGPVYVRKILDRDLGLDALHRRSRTRRLGPFLIRLSRGRFTRADIRESCRRLRKRFSTAAGFPVSRLWFCRWRFRHHVREDRLERVELIESRHISLSAEDHLNPPT